MGVSNVLGHTLLFNLNRNYYGAIATMLFALFLAVKKFLLYLPWNTGVKTIWL